MTPDLFDLVVLGAGSAGYSAALRARQLGLEVAMVDQDRLGGTCLHRGCIPAKFWLHAAEVADTVRHASELGITAELNGIDAGAILAATDQVIGKLYRGLQQLVAGSGVEQVSGTGRVVSDRAGLGVEVDGTVLRGRNVLVATGARPRTLGLPIDHEQVLTSDDALRLTSLPERAVIIGGGVIGVEFASAWNSLGVQVVLVEATDRLLPTEEPDISRFVQRALTRRGIEVRLGAGVRTVTAGRSDQGRGVEVELLDDQHLQADLALVAVGREPNTSDIGLDAVGVRTDRGHVRVNDRLMSSVGGIFAAGDVVRGPQLAHRGFSQGIFVAEVLGHQRGLTARAPELVPDHQIARVTYANPEVASVGLTSEQAARTGPIRSVDASLGANGRSLIKGANGFVRVIRRPDGPIVGVHMVGQGVGELIGQGQLVTGWEALPEEVALWIQAHPTQSEAFGEACLALAGRPLHLHP